MTFDTQAHGTSLVPSTLANRVTASGYTKTKEMKQYQAEVAALPCNGCAWKSTCQGSCNKFKRYVDSGR